MNKPLVFSAGVLVGALLFVSARALMVNNPLPVDHVSADPAVQKSAQSALARDKELKSENAQREAYVDRAENRLGLNGPAAGTTAAAAKNDQANMMKSVISGVIKQQMQMKLAAMKARLNLTPDQEKAIGDMLDQQAQLAESMTGQLMSGKLSPADMKKAAQAQGVGSAGINEQLASILSPDQQAEYKTMQADDRKNQVEASTNLELSTVQGSLQLSDTQKDQVFNALLQANQQPAKGDLAAQNEAKKAALQPLLTPAQYDTYSKYLDSQTQMINSLMQSSQAAGSDTPAPAAQ